LYKQHFRSRHTTEGNNNGLLFQIQYNLSTRYFNNKGLVESNTESEETDEGSLIEPDRAISLPALPMSSAENKFPLPSAKLNGTITIVCVG
jgi:hypothetical protein